VQSSGHQVTNLPNPGVGGWLLLLCLLLMVWQPVSVGLTASGVLASIALGGFPLVLVLMLRLLVTAFGVAAGLALFSFRAGAVTLARVALLASAATDLFVYLTPYFPANRAPGETPIFVTASLTYHAGWILYLSRSRRVRATFADDA
jgi:hypothetical protein